MKFIIGQKQAMTQLFQDDGTVVPATVIKAIPNTISAVRTPDKDGYVAVQVGAGIRKSKRLKKPQRENWKDIGAFAKVKEFRLETTDGYERGTKIDVAKFEVGDLVQATGISKGKGFAGVVKRHHFRGGPASHGHKDNLRAPGSIGATFPQHVMKGTRMAGRMGNKQVTVRNLKIVAVKPETNELWISGAVPGHRNTWLMIASARIYD